MVVVGRWLASPLARDPGSTIQNRVKTKVHRSGRCAIEQNDNRVQVGRVVVMIEFFGSEKEQIGLEWGLVV